MSTEEILKELDTATKLIDLDDEDDDEDDDDDDEDYKPTSPPTTRTITRKTKASNKKPSKKIMSIASQKVAEAANLLVSSAHADIDRHNRVAECVFLSKPYERNNEAVQGFITTHKYYAVLVLVFAKRDSGKVTAQPLTNGGETKTIRITKPKNPHFMSDPNTRSTFLQMIFADEKGNIDKSYVPIIQALSQGIIEEQNQDDNKTIVDVHFDKPIQPRVRKVKQKHLTFNSSAVKRCTICGQGKILQKPDVLVFEVEEIKFVETAQSSTKGAETTGYMSE